MFEIAIQLLTCHYLATWMIVNALSFWNVNSNKVGFFLLVSCLCNKQNNAWLLGDMEFVFSCSIRYLTHSLSSLVRYWVEHSKRNSLSPRVNVLPTIYLALHLRLLQMNLVSIRWYYQIRSVKDWSIIPKLTSWQAKKVFYMCPHLHIFALCVYSAQSWLSVRFAQRFHWGAIKENKIKKSVKAFFVSQIVILC